MTRETEKSIPNFITFIPVVILAVCSGLLFIRSFYSFSWTDESFYLTIVHRLWLGERIIADEWYTTQLSSPLLLPFYALYQWMTGGNEGVYLYFRLLYWGISVFTAFYAYFRLKRENSLIASLICALMYLFYSRANIGGMSYYNMTLTCVLLAVLLLYGMLPELDEAHRRQKGCRVFSGYKLFMTGILLALAVVFTPYLAVPYVMIWIYLLLRKKYRPFRGEVLLVTAGTAAAAVLYLSYILRRVSLNELLLNIPYVLDEPELQSTNPLLAVPMILIRIAWRYKWTICFSAFLIIYLLYGRKKDRVLSHREAVWLFGINLLIFIVNAFLSANLLGCIYIAGVLFIIPMFLLFWDRERLDRRICTLFGAAGFSVALGFSFSSDTGLDAMAIGFVLIGIGAVLQIFKMERVQNSRMVYGAVLFMCSLMVFQTGILRLFSIYRDAPLGRLDTRITSGPARFLYTTDEHAGQYDRLKAAIETYVREDDLVFYSKQCFWSYLCTHNGYGVPSSWRMAMDSPRLEEYYRLNPDKLPTCIFVLNAAYGDYESTYIQGNEKERFPNENHMEGFLYDYIQNHDYEVIELECATIYRSRQTQG